MFVFGLTSLVCILAPLVTAQGNKKLVVTTVINEPFVFHRENGSGYQGFVVDILDHVARTVGVTYEIRPSRDGRYGGLQKDGTWNGMIGELIRGEADIAASGLTITATRSRVVRFTHQFAASRLAILVKKPAISRPSKITDDLVTPLHCEVWILSLVCCFLVAGAMSLIAVLSPWEKLGVDGSMLAVGGKGMTIPNSLMFAFSTAMWQGYHVTPRSVSGRTLAISWWLFVLFLLITYTASLTSHFVAVSSRPTGLSTPSPPFRSLQDLAAQTRIKYGTIASGSTAAYFRSSKNEVNQKIHVGMTTAVPSGFVNTVAEGVERVRESNGDYAFIMEGMTAAYYTRRMCDLMVVHVSHEARLTEYGLAVPIGSPLTDSLTLAILQLTESDVLDMLRYKWFEETDVCREEQQHARKEASGLALLATSVDLHRFSLAYVILVVGTVLSLALLVGEIVWSKLRGEPTHAQAVDCEDK